MRSKTYGILLWACTTVCRAQTPSVRPEVVGRVVQEGEVNTVYLAPRFATAIRMLEAINAVVLGDPDSFSAEHSEKEPQIVFVKPITNKPAQTNLLISTTRGHQISLLLISRGESGSFQPSIDFVMQYHPSGHFLIEPSGPSFTLAQTEPLTALAERPTLLPPVKLTKRNPPAGDPNVIRAGFTPTTEANATTISLNEEGEPAGSSSELDFLLARQRKAPLPVLYGEKPGIAAPGKQILKAGVSEVVDQGREVVVLFSILNMQDHAVQLMTPQIQLAGQVNKGAIVHHKVWSKSEQLPVMEFRMSRRRLGPGERADGVAVFERPPFKQSNETLLLQMADSGDVDRPALAPIGFGISSASEGMR